MIVRNIIILLVLALNLVSCSTERIVIDVVNNGWPDGTSILAVCDGAIEGRTSLYGDRARITVSTPGNYSLRVTDRGYYASHTDRFQVVNGTTSVSLPAAISRRKTGNTEFGIDVVTQDPTASAMNILSDAMPSFTTLVIPSDLPGEDIANIASTAHRFLVSLTVRYDSTTTSDLLTSGNINPVLDSLTLAGVDGIAITMGSQTPEVLMDFVGEAHHRGLSISVLVEPEADVSVWGWDTVADTALPDEIRIIPFKSVPQRSQNPVQLIENLLNTPEFVAVSQPRLMVTFSLSAITVDGMTLAEGALVHALAAADGVGTIRLRDGSMRFGHLGTNYVYDDMESIRTKLTWLETRNPGQIGGICLSYDGRGIALDLEELEDIADLLRSW